MNHLFISIIFFILSFAVIKKAKRNIINAWLMAILIFLYLISIVFYVVADSLTNEGINDAVIYHLRYGLGGAGFADYTMIILTAVFLFVVSIGVSIYAFKTIERKDSCETKKYMTGVSFYLIIIAFVFNPTIQTLSALSLVKTTQYFQTHGELLFGNKNQMENVPRKDPMFDSQSQDFLQYYVAPKIIDENASHPNFIYIYAESLEQSYFNETVFPGLISGLRELQNKNTYFTNIDQIKGTGWTIAGMVSSQCALPLITPSLTAIDGNAMSNTNAFYGGATCLGDILSQYGYYLSFMQGSSIEFAGVGKFYQTHSFDEINHVFREPAFLRSEAAQSGNAWGLYDDDLLNIVYDETIRLFSTKEHVGIFTATIDTHHPDGHMSKSCSNIQYQDGSNPILNSVACADYLITKFIRKIQASDYGDNTVIIVSSDHLAMNNSATDLLNSTSRKNLFMIIDPRDKHSGTVEKKGAMIDVAPTILHILGYNNTNYALGHDLLSDSESLHATFDDINDKIIAWSSSIQKFWNFPQITTVLDIDTIKRNIKIGEYVYQYPLLVKLDKNLEVSVYSEIDSPKKLYEYLNEFDRDTSFIWIDRCDKVSLLDENINPYGDDCLLAGKLDSETIAVNLSEPITLSKNALVELFNKKSQKERYNYRVDTLHRLQADNSIDGSTQKDAYADKGEVQRFIAHAGGEIDGHRYTNSLEALNRSYAKGFKLFELDMIKTSDNVYVAAHDWDYWARAVNYSGHLPPTLQIFKQHKIHDLYTPLDISVINQWFLEHPDAILVTDKVNSPADFSRHFVDKSRLMMELFSLGAVREGISSQIKSAMASWNVVTKLNKNQANILASMGVKHIAASRRVIKDNIQLIHELNDKDIQTYVFHVNFDAGKDEMYVVCNEMNDIYGLYADSWDFNMTVNCVN